MVPVPTRIEIMGTSLAFRAGSGPAGISGAVSAATSVSVPAVPLTSGTACGSLEQLGGFTPNLWSCKIWKMIYYLRQPPNHRMKPLSSLNSEAGTGTSAFSRGGSSESSPISFQNPAAVWDSHIHCHKWLDQVSLSRAYTHCIHSLCATNSSWNMELCGMVCSNGPSTAWMTSPYMPYAIMALGFTKARFAASAKATWKMTAVRPHDLSFSCICAWQRITPPDRQWKHN